MGEREKVLIVDDSMITRKVLEDSVKSYGHEIVALCFSVKSVQKIIDEGLVGNVTVALVDGKMPCDGDGEKAARLLKDANPKVKIISVSGERQSWGDYNFQKASDLIDKLFEIISSF